MNINLIKITKGINCNIIAHIIWLIFFNEKLSATAATAVSILVRNYKSVVCAILRL